ncbi:MAG: hypothetical protein CVU41_17815 [Chloroflexi bacterium HGW-Chloroflexi-3]|nr:MAG: hypothetical protein CVU41_17815 [Chloroflexi bacterium HGW-Chloroflexi-3]
MNTLVKVMCREGEIGVLKEVIVNPRTLQPTYLIVERGNNPSMTLRVHVHSIVKVNEDKIILNKSMESLDFLTRFQHSALSAV